MQVLRVCAAQLRRNLFAVNMSRMTEKRDRQLAELQEIMDRHDATANGLALKAGIQPSTIYGFLDGSRSDTLRETTLRKIRAAFHEAEDRPTSAAETALPAKELQAIIKLPPFVPADAEHGFEHFEVLSDAMAHVDFRKGDIVRSERGAVPRNGELVIAQVPGDAGRPSLVLRFYETAWLISGTATGPHRKPIVLDGVTSRVIGVVREQFRRRFISPHVDVA
jgi:hypothetical protein